MNNRLFTLLIITFLFSSCSTVILVRSSWNKNKIVIDGNEDDWNDRTAYLPEQEISLGICNDTSYLYLYVKSLNQQQSRHIRMAGFTLWLDPNGNDEKTFGIRIPRRQFRAGEWADDGVEAVTNNTSDIEILQNGEEKPVPMDPVQLREIQLGTSSSRNGTMFEFRIPLSIKMENGSVIELKNNYVGIRLESGKMGMPRKDGEKPDGREWQGEGYPDEVRGEGERPESGRGGRRLREDSKLGKRIQSIDFWFKISLSMPKM